MVKYIVLLLVLYGLEALASPSAGYQGSMSNGCQGALPCAGSTASPPTLDSAISELARAMAAVVAQSNTDIPKTTPALYQSTVQNLTRIVEQLTASVMSTTPAPAPRCDCEAQVAQCQLTVQNLTRTQTEMTQRAAQTCPVSGYEYSNVNGRCYKRHRELVTWPVANSTCHEEGALLAVINSREEARVLGDIERRTINGTQKVCFVGVYRDDTDHWKTVTGEDVVEAAGFHVWYGSEPWHDEQWQYGVVQIDTGLLYTTTYSNSLNFICEMAAV